MKKIAPVFVMLAGILWGMMGIFVRRLNEFGLNSMDIALTRSFWTFLMLFVYLLLFKRDVLKIKLKDVWCFLGTGMASVAFFNVSYFKAIVSMSLSMAAVLLYTAPAIVMMLSVFLFHEKMSVRKVMALIVAFLGCMCVTGVLSGNVQISKSGILLGLGAGFGYALYSIFSRYALNKGYSSLTITFYTFLFASIGVLPFIDLPTFTSFYISHNSGPILLWSILMAIVTTLAAYILYTLGLTYMESSKASIIATIEPVVASLIGILLYHESVTFLGVPGIILVLSSTVLINLHSRVK